MKTTISLSSVCRRLAASVLLPLVFGVSASMAAVTLVTAHADLAAGNFSALKTDTETLLGDPASGQEAHVLHAIALLGLAAKNDVPVYLVSLGAKAGATVDPVGNGTRVDFPTAFTYDTGANWTQSGATYSLARAFNYGDNNKPLICFENRGSVDYTLTLQMGTSVGSLFEYEGSLILNGSDWGFIDAYSANGHQHFWGELPGGLEGSLNPETNTASFTLHPGDNLTIEDGRNSAGVRFTIVGTRPSTLVVLNGKGVYDAHPKFAAGANVTGLFAFAAKEDSSVLAPVVGDLAAVTATNFQMILPSSETGHPMDVVIQYPDVQLAMAFLKINQGLRLLSTSYNWSFDLSGGLFMEATDPLAVMAKNASLLTAVTNATPASRTAAKALLDAAAQHYVNADTAGLWSRPVLIGSTYLIMVDTDHTEDLAARRASFLDGVTMFRNALVGQVNLAGVFADFATVESLPDATCSLAPLFAATPLNVRGLFPAFTQNGIQAGTSMKLLASGLFTGVTGEKWDDYMDFNGLIDPSVPAAKTAPVISVQPQGATVLAGVSQTFTVQAVSYPAPTYQWKKNGTVINGETGSSYTIDPVAGADAGSYTVAVSNGTTTVTSAIARLVVGFAPEITTQPVSQNVKAGTAVKFTVAAAGNPAPTFQWKKDGAAITGATKALYSCKAGEATAGTYTVDVVNNLGTVTSADAVLTVGFPPAITTQPTATQTVTAGQSVTLTVVAGGTDPKTYQWKKGTVVINGATAASYTIDPVAGTDAGSYTVTVTNDYGTVIGKVAKLTVLYAPVITTQPVPVSAKLGATVKFTVVANGNPVPTYQWRRNGTPIPKATKATYSVKAGALTTGNYDVVVTNSVDSITSSPAELSLQGNTFGVVVMPTQ